MFKGKGWGGGDGCVHFWRPGCISDKLDRLHRQYSNVLKRDIDQPNKSD